jgi:hypothetical protein
VSTTVQELSDETRSDGNRLLDKFLAVDRGVLRSMTTKPDPTNRRQNILEIESSLRHVKEFPIVNENSAAHAYSLIVEYFKKNGYDDAEFFAQRKILLFLVYRNFSKTEDDLRRDLGLLEFEPPMPDTTLDLNAEAARLGLSPKAALHALKQAAAQHTTKRAAGRRLVSGTDNALTAGKKPIPTTIEAFRRLKQSYKPRKHAEARANEPPEIRELREIKAAGEALMGYYRVKLSPEDRESYNQAHGRLRAFLREQRQPHTT